MLRSARQREGALAALLLAVVLAATNLGVIFQGRSLVYTDQFNHLDPRPRPENYGPDFVPLETWRNANLVPWVNQHDPGGTWWQWEPAAIFTRRALLSGQMPWWDPYVGGGVPAATNPTGTSFFPPYLLWLLLFGTGSGALTAYALVVWYGSALCTFLFLRRSGLTAASSLVGALAFCFASAMAQNIGSMLGQTIACLPVLLLATAWLMDYPSRRRVAATAVLYGGVALSSFAPLLVGIFGFTGAYALVRWLRGPAPATPFTPRHQWIGFAASGAVGVLLASFYLVPVAALVTSNASSEAYREAYTEVVQPANLLQLASPTLLGASKVQAAPWLRTDNSALEVPAVGVICLLLVAVARRPRKAAPSPLWPWAAALALLVIAKLVGAQPLQALASLPVLRYIHYPPYFSFLLSFPLCVLAALGFEGLRLGDLSPRRAAVAPAAGIVVWLTIRWLAQSRGLSDAFLASWIREWCWTAAVLALGSAGILLAAVARPGRWRVSAWILILLALALEGHRNTAYPRQKRWGIWDHPPRIVQILQRAAGGERVLELGAFEPNSGSAFEVFQVGSHMAFNSPRMRELYRAATGSLQWLFLRQAERLPTEGFLSRANVSTIVLNRQLPAPLREDLEDRRHNRLFADGQFAVYRRATLPRYFFTSEYRVLDASEALERTLSTPPTRRLFLEQVPGARARPNRRRDPAVVVERFAINGYVLTLVAPRPGLVYMSETDMRGWHATVNGRAVETLRANYAFRAVEVPAGANRIEMRYRPPGLRLGVLLSSLGALVVATLGIRRRSSGVETEPSA